MRLPKPHPRRKHLGLLIFSTLLFSQLPVTSLIADDHSKYSESGPRQADEPSVLTEKAILAIQESHFSEAVPYLQRFIDRYPAHPDTLTNTRRLGEALFYSNQFSKVATPLRRYIAAKGEASEADEMRILMAQALIEAKRPSQALAVIVEIIGTSDIEQGRSKLGLPVIRKRVSPPNQINRVSALLIRCHALLELKQFDEATQTWDSANRDFITLDEKTRSRLEAPLLAMQLKLELRECERFPTAKTMSEAQAKDQMERKALCLAKSIQRFQPLLKTGSLGWIEKAAKDIVAGYRHYYVNSSSPPAAPLETGEDKQSAQQLATYQKELATFFLKNFEQRTAETRSFLRAWSAEISENAKTASARLIGEIDALSSHKPKEKAPAESTR